MTPPRAVLAALLLTPALAPAQGVPTWTLDPELRIGSAEAGPFALQSIPSLTVSPRTGAVFVSQDQAIVAFDASGRFLRNIGRGGSGPGEIRRAPSFLGWSGEHLFAAESTPFRLTRFTEAGELVDVRDDEPGPSPGGALPPLPQAFLDDGSILAVDTGEDPAADTPELLVRIDPDGETTVLDGLRSPGQMGVYTSAAGPVYFPQPLPWRSRYAADPRGSGVVVVHQPVVESGGEAEFRVRKLGPDGEVLFDRGYRFQPRAVAGEAIVDDLVERRRASPAFTGASAPEIREAHRVPRFEPPVSGVVAGADGSTWLRREAHGLEHVWWTILDPEGDPIGRVVLPARARILHADGDVVWGSESLQRGVTHAVRYRIRR